MVEHDAERTPRESSEAAELDGTFSALADPTRRAILARLREGEATVSELAAPFEISLNAISKHVRVLERAGLVHRQIRGREHHCHLEAAPMGRAVEWTAAFRSFWEQRPDRSEHFLERRPRPSGRIRE